ncbi:MAG TPA: serine--tRNA ligase [Fastidiosipila sp.]|jgi:seryl-tRNA synthetase|nr:serine--tRNA ligase [Eubacteriales bacterium]HHU04830.1 serine--tRNA ligase [Fastidiosipila sp.]
MLDIVYIRNKPEEAAARLAKRGVTVDFSEFLEKDAERRSLMHTTENLKAERNKKSAEIPKLKKEGLDTSELLAELKQLSETISSNDEKIDSLQREQEEFLQGLPNLPAEDVVAGGKEANQVVHTFGEQRDFDFEPKHHVDLLTSLGMIDYERGAKLSGSGYWLYTGLGARLEWALINYFVDAHLADGYEMVMPPYLLNYDAGYAAGQFPKFLGDIFEIRSNDDNFRFLLPTAETALVNYHRDEIMAEEELPHKLFAYTACFRREAGSHGANERGMIRGHQFNKVEMFQFSKPEDSDAALDELVKKACALVEGLGLHYQLVKLAAGDVGAAMKKTYDVEIWIPSMGGYKEVSSVSNAGDYQARRGNVRFRRAADGKVEFADTLNGSGLATSRVMPAIAEQYQQADGSIVVPEVLRPYMGGIDIIRPL